MAIGNMYTKFSEDWTYSSRDMLVYRQTPRQTYSSQYSTTYTRGGVFNHSTVGGGTF